MGRFGTKRMFIGRATGKPSMSRTRRRYATASLSHIIRRRDLNGRPSREWPDSRLMVRNTRCSLVSLTEPARTRGPAIQAKRFICGWTFRPERTVKRAVAGLRARKLVTVVDRGTTSNAYIIDWKPIFAAYQEMKRFEKRHALRSAEPKVAPLGQTVGPEVARKPMKGTSELREPMALSGSSDDEPYLVDIKKVEESLQREQAVELSPSPQTPSPAEPLLRERANKAVFDLMTPFDWDHCTEEAFEAAIVAEMAKPGSGRAIVVASSSEAWSAKRKGDGQ